MPTKTLACLAALAIARCAAGEIITHTYDPPLFCSTSGGGFFAGAEAPGYRSGGFAGGSIGNGPELYSSDSSIDFNVLGPGGVPFHAGEIIGSNLSEWSNEAVLGAGFGAGLFLPFRLQALAGGHGYGWFSVVSNGSGATIFGYGFETTPETDIPAGAVPAPSSLCLLGLGGLLSACHRRPRVVSSLSKKEPSRCAR